MDSNKSNQPKHLKPEKIAIEVNRQKYLDSIDKYFTETNTRPILTICFSDDSDQLYLYRGNRLDNKKAIAILLAMAKGLEEQENKSGIKIYKATDIL